MPESVIRMILKAMEYIKAKMGKIRDRKQV